MASSAKIRHRDTICATCTVYRVNKLKASIQKHSCLQADPKKSVARSRAMQQQAQHHTGGTWRKPILHSFLLWPGWLNNFRTTMTKTMPLSPPSCPHLAFSNRMPTLYQCCCYCRLRHHQDGSPWRCVPLQPLRVPLLRSVAIGGLLL